MAFVFLVKATCITQAFVVILFASPPVSAFGSFTVAANFNPCADNVL